MGTEQVPVAGSHDPLRRSRLKHLQEQLRSLPICALPLHEAAGQQNNWPTFIADNETANRCPTVLSNWLPAATISYCTVRSLGALSGVARAPTKSCGPRSF